MWILNWESVHSEYERTEEILKSHRSSRGVFCEKGVLENFTQYTGNHLCQSVFF